MSTVVFCLESYKVHIFTLLSPQLPYPIRHNLPLLPLDRRCHPKHQYRNWHRGVQLRGAPAAPVQPWCPRHLHGHRRPSFNGF